MSGQTDLAAELRQDAAKSEAAREARRARVVSELQSTIVRLTDELRLSEDRCDPDVLWGLTAEEDVGRLEGLPLWHLTIEAACKVRWIAGRRARGRALEAPFDGDPVAEALEEAIDLVNYLREEGLDALASQARGLADEIRELLIAREAHDAASRR